MSDTSKPPGQDKNSARIRDVISKCIRSRADGQNVSDESLIAAHPNLMPALGEELRKLRVIATARHLATRPFSADESRGTHDSDSGQLEVCCPSCHASMKVSVDTPLTDLTCSACGDNFSLVDQQKKTWTGSALCTLGRFELIERIGIGAFGTVWKARDLQLHRTVAIKIPRQGSVTTEEQEKFFREARAAAQLRHPNIVSVHEVGRNDGSIYIVSDFVRGVTLSDWLTAQQPTGRDAADLCAKLADALHHAHEHGIVHRDLKPANVMIDMDGEPHLMDFGLARRDVDEVTVTTAGNPFGTPAYMSPEQAAGHAHTADRRSDLYSLGTIFFQLLTGELPFRGNALTLVHQVIHDPPPSPRKFNARIPRDLETIALKCLEKEPSRRYTDAKVLGDEFRRFLRREPIQARPVGRVERCWRWCKRNPVPAIASAIAATALLSVLVVTICFAFYQQRSASLLRDEKEHTSTALAEAYLDRGLVLSSQGEVGQGLLWMARSLELAAPTDNTLQQSIRTNIASWTGEVHPLEHILDHQGLVYAVAFSPDGKLLLTGGKDCSARLWNVKTGQLVAKLSHKTPVLCVAFHRDGNRLATGSADGTTTIWDAHSGRILGKPIPHPKKVLSIAFSPDGATLLTGCEDGMARKWNVATQTVLGTPFSHTHPIYSVAFNHDGSKIATGTGDTYFRLWDTVSGKQEGEPRGYDPEDLGPKNAVFSLAFSPVGDKLVTASSYAAKLWQTDKPGLVSMAFGHQSFVKGVAFGPDGRSIVTASVDNKVRVWDVASEKPIGAPLIHQHPVWAVAISPDGQTIATGSGDEFGDKGEARIWKMAPPAAPSLVLPHPSSVWAVAYTPDGQAIATGCQDAKARLWSVQAPKQPSKSLQSEGPVYALSLSSDGLKLATGGGGKTPGEPGFAHLWDVTTGQTIGNPVKQAGPIWAVALSPDNQILVAGGKNEEAIKYQLPDMQPLAHSLKHATQINAIAFSPDGRTILTGSEYDMAARRWDAGTGQPIGLPMLHQNVVKAVAFSPDGKLVATGCWNNYAQLWSSETGKAVGPQLRHADSVWAVAFSPDGQTLATASIDRTAQLWEVATGRRLGRPYRHGGHVLDVAFRPDGKAILTGSFESENLAQEWPVPQPVSDEAHSLMLRLVQITGMELDESGEVHLLDDRDRRAVHEELASPQDEITSPPESTPPPSPATNPKAEVLDHDDLIFTSSTQIQPGIYRVQDKNETGVMRIKGDNIVIDGQGATLNGAADGQDPDQFHGLGIVVEDSSNVVVRNFKVRGFKVAIYAKNCHDILIENCDVSDNWKMRLHSTPQAEDEADWLHPHDNEDNQWLNYGAGIYLESCQNIGVRKNVCHRGQNGLCFARSSLGQAYDNDFSFNSGWGVALYRSRRIEVSHNKCDWCIRGYSHGVYNRGQDSAAILVFEQSSNNVFAFNSCTHSGDGFFLFAGNETINTGEGGSNQNLVYGNDFSCASNNGIEATFSANNCFANNIIDEADHAIWAGYSYDSVFVNNRIRRCNNGISIEHGNNNSIEGNQLSDCGVAINLWSGDDSNFAKGPFGTTHSCRSEKYDIAKNRLHNNHIQLRLATTSQTTIQENELDGHGEALQLNGNCRAIEFKMNNVEGPWNGNLKESVTFERNFWKTAPESVLNRIEKSNSVDFSKIEKAPAAPAVHGSLDAFLSKNIPRGRQYILVDEWGPYDFQQPRVVPAELAAWNDGLLQVLAVDGKFAVEDVQGSIVVAPEKGTLPGRLKVALAQPKTTEFSFVVHILESGKKLRASGLLLAAKWDVNFYRWEDGGPKKPPADWASVIAAKPLLHQTVASIDYRWQMGGPDEKVGVDHFATVATTEMELPAGNWEFRTVSDDGVRLYVDGKLLIDNWTWHGPTQDSARIKLAGGKHQIRLEHFEIDGWAQLELAIQRAK